MKLITSSGIFMGKNFEWLPRAIMFSPYYICLCTTEKGFHAVLKKLKVPKNKWPDYVKEDFGACVYTFEHPDGHLLAVVNMERSNKPAEEIYPLLVHEATHILQHILDFIGETEPSKEFQAYSMQNISQNLFESYKRQTSSKKGEK